MEIVSIINSLSHSQFKEFFGLFSNSIKIIKNTTTTTTTVVNPIYKEGAKDL